MTAQQPDMTVVGEAAHGAEAVRKTAELRPDIVLMDVRMPGVDGIEATRRIMNADSSARVMVLTTFGLESVPTARCGPAPRLRDDGAHGRR